MGQSFVDVYRPLSVVHNKRFEIEEWYFLVIVETIDIYPTSDGTANKIVTGS